MSIPACLAALLVLQLGQQGQADGTPETPDPQTQGDESSDVLPVLSERVVVTASRFEQKVRDVPSSVTVFTREEVQRSSAQTLDDLLRTTSGFTPLREGGSRAAHPNVRSAAMRLGGSSSVSRTLFLVDGVPINEPMSGAVYWARVPVESIERVEIVKSGSSGVWGNLALGGVVNIITTAPPEDGLRVRATVEGGNRESGRVHASLSGGRGAFGGRLTASYETTGGYIVFRPDQTGPIDEPVSSTSRAIDGRLEYRHSPDAVWTVGGNVYTEDQGFGTPLARNGIELGQVQIGGRFTTHGQNAWHVLGVATRQRIDSVLTSVARDRASETPATDQFDVPATSVAGSVQWARPLGARHLISAGADVQWLDAEFNELFSFVAGRFTRSRRAGGEQALGGARIQHLFHVSDRWTLVGAARLDRWQTRNGTRIERDTATGAPVRDERFANHVFWSLSPNLGVIHHFNPRWSWRASAYRGFRAPVTLELYRPFRTVNSVITESNALLSPERVTGIEASVDARAHRSVQLRVTGFWNHLDDPMVAVSVDTAGASGRTIEPCGFVPAGGACRQMQNLGRMRIAGIESEASYAGPHGLAASLAHVFTRASVTQAPAQPQLVGLDGRHSPVHQLVASAAYEGPRAVTVSAYARYVSRRFADDVNRLALGSFVVVDLRVARRFTSHVEPYVRFQNLFDRTYLVNRSEAGIDTIGAPRLIAAGVRVAF